MAGNRHPAHTRVAMVGDKNLGRDVSDLVCFPTVNGEKSLTGEPAVLDCSAQPVVSEPRDDGNAVGLGSCKLSDKLAIKMIGVKVGNVDGVPAPGQQLLILKTFKGREVVSRAEKGTVCHPRVTQNS